MLLARFRRHYGDALWRDPSYRTWDGTVPFGVFWIYYRAMQANYALERWQQSRAITVALGQAFAKQGDGLSDLTKAELREAFLR